MARDDAQAHLARHRQRDLEFDFGPVLVDREASEVGVRYELRPEIQAHLDLIEQVDFRDFADELGEIALLVLLCGANARQQDEHSKNDG